MSALSIRRPEFRHRFVQVGDGNRWGSSILMRRGRSPHVEHRRRNCPILVVVDGRERQLDSVMDDADWSEGEPLTSMDPCVSMSRRLVVGPVRSSPGPGVQDASHVRLPGAVRSLTFLRRGDWTNRSRKAAPGRSPHMFFRALRPLPSPTTPTIPGDSETPCEG